METNRISALRNVVNAEPRGDATTAAIDLVFLEAQTFADPELEREVLTLFVAQARRVVPNLPGLSARMQREAAHLLKGSARGIGAWAAAAVAEAYEQAEAAARTTMQADLTATFAEADAAIATRLSSPAKRGRGTVRSTVEGAAASSDAVVHGGPAK